MVNESPGFVTSRINALIGNEAFRMLETGVASPEDIDKAMHMVRAVESGIVWVNTFDSLQEGLHNLAPALAHAARRAA